MSSAMLQNRDLLRSPCSQRSFADSIALHPHSIIAKDAAALCFDRDNTSQTEENGKAVSTLQPGNQPNGAPLPGSHFDIDSDPEFARENESFSEHPFSCPFDTLQIVPLSNECGLPNWTVRNSEGYQEELVKHEHGSCNLFENHVGLRNNESESPQTNSSFFAYESDTDNITVHLILSFPDSVDGEAWNSIQSSLAVAQSVTQHDFASPFPQAALSCDQRSEEIPTSEMKLAREISASISVKHYLNSIPARHLFQLYLVINEKNEVNFAKCPWNRLNIVAFVQFPSTGQLLLPIETEVSRREALSSTGGMFLGSFVVQNKQMFHHIPNEPFLRRQEIGTSRQCMLQTSKPFVEDVVIVDRKDIVLEPNGARAGRPSHKETGQLLMTESQVKKILEIRKRWEGLSARQRRDNVSPSDFYTFLTLNRDETAECLGVCATWLKDAIRSQGMNVWPGRPLRKTGAMLQTLKERLESARAALRFSDPAINETKPYEANVHRYENEIRELVSMRVEIVKANVSPEYFQRFMQENGSEHLDPTWNALPLQPRQYSS